MKTVRYINSVLMIWLSDGSKSTETMITMTSVEATRDSNKDASSPHSQRHIEYKGAKNANDEGIVTTQTRA